MFCESCGKQIADNLAFCPECGAKIMGAAASEPQNNAGQQQQTYQNYQQSNQQPNYQPAPPYQAQVFQPQPDMTVGQWVGTLLLLCIPIANLVLLLVWAFGSDTHIAKKNFSKASLILMLVSIGLSIILAIVGVGLFATVADVITRMPY